MLQIDRSVLGVAQLGCVAALHGGYLAFRPGDPEAAVRVAAHRSPLEDRRELLSEVGARLGQIGCAVTPLRPDVPPFWIHPLQLPAGAHDYPQGR